jgi:hypothetical protein
MKPRFGWAPWRRDTRLSDLLHPDYPDDIQALLHDGGPLFRTAAPELVWVRLTDRVDDGIYRGTLLNQPFGLTNRQQGDTIHVAVADGAHRLVYIGDRYLYERYAWSVDPCHQCGLSVLFDAPSDLLAATFAKVPADLAMVEFTATCPLCGGKQFVRSASWPAFSA